MKTQPNEPIALTTTDQNQFTAFTGLTKREYFAAILMSGKANSQGDDFATVAEWAVIGADALIAELNKGSSK